MEKEKKPISQNSFADKVQDFLYDNIDYIIMIAVVILVGLIINWRLTNLFKDSTIVEDTLAEGQVITVDSKKSGSENKSQENIEKDKIEEKKEMEKVLNISIPKGAASQTVSEILEKEGLVEDKDEFHTYITEKGLETKLKYGEYEIPDNATFDEIIEILTK